MPDIFTISRSWLGTPFAHRQSTKGRGCDCAGLILGVGREYTKRGLPDPIFYSERWANTGSRNDIREYLETNFYPEDKITPGKILLLKIGKVERHLGILLEDGSFIHSKKPQGVVRSAFHSRWEERVAGVFEWQPPFYIP